MPRCRQRLEPMFDLELGACLVGGAAGKYSGKFVTYAGPDVNGKEGFGGKGDEDWLVGESG